MGRNDIFILAAVGIGFYLWWRYMVEENNVAGLNQIENGNRDHETDA